VAAPSCSLSISLADEATAAIKLSWQSVSGRTPNEKLERVVINLYSPRLRNSGRAASGLAGLLMALLTMVAAHGQQRRASLIDLATGDAGSLTKALRAQGLDVVQQDRASRTFTGSLIVLEATGTSLDDGTVDALEKFVQRGGSLLLAPDRLPGKAPIQLAPITPTTSWETQASSEGRPLRFDAIEASGFDPEIFGASSPAGVKLPYFFHIQPLSTAERGVARYDRYTQQATVAGPAHKAGEFFWTRRLLNRDWRVRVRGNDRRSSPLLITGSYGAGRVAVFASGLTGDDPSLAAMWSPVIAWLTHTEAPRGDEPAAGAVEVTTTPVLATATAAGKLRVTLKNRTSAKLDVQVLGRILTWEGALVGDDLVSAEIAANGSTAVELAMPAPGPEQYQAVDWRQAFVVRLGVLSSSGATLLAESVVKEDVTPAASLELQTDNLYHVTYPFSGAPGLKTDPMPVRMGMDVRQYAYLPSGTVHATAVLTNGVRNIAPLATVTDETTPGNPSLVAINDLGTEAAKPPRGPVEGYGMWIGKAGVENVLHLRFPAPVTVTAVTLVGSPTKVRDFLAHNPGAVSIECDGKVVARQPDLDTRFPVDDGLVRLNISPQQATEITVRMPWVELVAQKTKRSVPWLGEIEIEGSVLPLPPELKGDATLVLRDAWSATETVVGRRTVSIAPGGRLVWNQAVKLPANNMGMYQLQLRFAGLTKTLPVLTIQPAKTLIAVESLHPPDEAAAGFLTTKGLRNLFTLDAGTRDATSPWETPDDLVFAYSRQLKQIDSSSRSWSDWLYLTNSDLRHYTTPWTIFPNGSSVFAEGNVNLVSMVKRHPHYATSATVGFGFSDRWDSGPSLATMFSWQEIVAFDEHLRAGGKEGLTGLTHADLCRDINTHHAAEWAAWQEQHYVATVEMLQKDFEKDGKELTISGQGIPMTSNADATIISRTVKGMSSDNTWGMENEDILYTTGRQLANQAFNPEWKLGFNFVWGWDTTTLNNAYWFSPVGTTESSRRHYYDMAWRGLLNEEGKYQSSFTYGYGKNGGSAWTMALNDYQQNWNAQERFSLIYPEKPLGAGLIVSSSLVDSPNSVMFDGGGMGTGGSAETLIRQVATTFENLTKGGLSIPFTGNIQGLRHWTGDSPLIVEDLTTVTTEEVDILRSLAERGVRIAGFAGHGSLNAPVAALFGVNSDGVAVSAAPSGTAGQYTLLEHGNLLYLPLRSDQLTPAMSVLLAPTLQRWLKMPVVLPEGTLGYAFVSGGRSMIVLEDWQEKARMLSLRMRANGTRAHAVSLNDHNSLAIHREGPDWVVDVPIRPGDGEVVVIQEDGVEAVHAAMTTKPAAMTTKPDVIGPGRK
jgi:hypothetical protein